MRHKEKAFLSAIFILIFFQGLFGESLHNFRPSELRLEFCETPEWFRIALIKKAYLLDQIYLAKKIGDLHLENKTRNDLASFKEFLFTGEIRSVWKRFGKVENLSSSEANQILEEIGFAFQKPIYSFFLENGIYFTGKFSVELKSEGKNNGIKVDVSLDLPGTQRLKDDLERAIIELLSPLIKKKNEFQAVLVVTVKK